MSDTEIIDDTFDDEDRRDRWRNIAILAVIFLSGVLVALWVGFLISDSQEEEAKATTTAVRADQEATEARAEKYTLAQQVAAACAGGTLDEDVQTQLCSDAREVVKEGPRGAQGIPGIQGVQGVPGKDGAQGEQGVQGVPGAAGANGADGSPGETGPQGATGEQGPQGPTGPQGEPGAIGPAGPPGKDGQPPYSWLVFDENQNIIESCERAEGFDPAAPRYTCTQTSGLPTP